MMMPEAAEHLNWRQSELYSISREAESQLQDLSQATCVSPFAEWGEQ